MYHSGSLNESCQEPKNIRVDCFNVSHTLLHACLLQQQ